MDEDIKPEDYLVAWYITMVRAALGREVVHYSQPRMNLRQCDMIAMRLVMKYKQG